MRFLIVGAPDARAVTLGLAQHARYKDFIILSSLFQSHYIKLGALFQFPLRVLETFYVQYRLSMKTFPFVLDANLVCRYVVHVEGS